MNRFVALLVLVLSARGFAQQPLLNPLFSDHVVLQRDKPISVWGRATAGDNITITLGDNTTQARADASGRWSTTLPAMSAGGPLTLTARASGGATQSANDVLIGDVWLCSGQSNMELPVKRTLNWDGEVANSTNDHLRHVKIPLANSALPRDTFSGPIQWQNASPKTTADFTAACYYFARELQKTVNVPMGLVNASWGGSNIQTWMSDAAVRSVGGYDELLDVLRLYGTDQRAALLRWGKVWENWWHTRTTSQPDPWSATPMDTSWRRAPAGLGFWESWGVPELADFNGMVWFRTDVDLTTAQAAQAATLSIGPVDDVDMTWVNGVTAGGTSSPSAPRNYGLPAGSLHAGNNVIVVNALDVYATGGMYGPPQNRMLRFADGSTVPLAQWWYQIVPPRVGQPPRMPWDPTGGVTTIGNAMIVPLGTFGFKGVVWYQGESNTGDWQDYQQLLATWMADWRARFGADLPFLIVQLAGYGPAWSMPSNSGWAGVREAERLAVLNDKHAGLAVAFDLGERNDIHPANKQDVGRRLARAARHVIYGDSIAPSGPVPVSATRLNDEVTVKFSDFDRQLVAYSADGPIGFELCDQAACRYVPARIERDVVHLSIPPGMFPTRVRYCWADNPVCTLYDRSGLPAGPFEFVVTQPQSSANPSAPMVATWAAAPQLTEPRNMPPVDLSNKTLRQALRVSIAGPRLRVRFSNAFGNAPLVIKSAHIARYAGNGAIDSTTDRALSFNGQPGSTILAGQEIASDLLDFPLTALADVAITTSFGNVPSLLTGHPGSRMTSYIEPGGATTEHWYVISAIDVVADNAHAIAILGNSITDGRGSTTNSNDRWPDMLSRRLQANKSTRNIAVLNLGTGGNCVLRACLGPAALARYQKDILDQPGVKWVIVLEGVNDIGGVRGPEAAAAVARGLIAGYLQMIQQAHARGLKIYGATITPFEGSMYSDADRERARVTVNEWIRTSKAFDAVIDFDAALRDPAHPTRLRPDADTGDHLHPNANGYRFMGETIDLKLFSGK